MHIPSAKCEAIPALALDIGFGLPMTAIQNVFRTLDSNKKVLKPNLDKPSVSYRVCPEVYPQDIISDLVRIPDLR